MRNSIIFLLFIGSIVLMGIISNGFFQNIDYHAIIVSISDFLLTIGTIYFVLWFFWTFAKIFWS